MKIVSSQWSGSQQEAFCFALCAMLFALSSSASAQQTGKIFRIGFLEASNASTIAVRLEAFRQELPDGSYGQKLAMGAARGQRTALEGRYGTNPDARSHGEVFLTLLASRLTPGGLYFLDEPEAPLSPRGVLQLIALIQDRVAHDCQFIVATHSPMLLALPEATIYLFDGDAIRRTPYAEVEHVQLVKAFLNDPQRFLQHFK